MTPVHGVVCVPLYDIEGHFTRRPCFDVGNPLTQCTNPAHTQMTRLQRVLLGNKFQEAGVSGVGIKLSFHPPQHQAENAV